MYLNPDLRIHKLGKHYMIVDNCTDNSNLATVYTLNAIAGWLWRQVEGTDFSIESLTELICNKYEVTRDNAEADVRSLVDKWLNFGLIIS